MTEYSIGVHRYEVNNDRFAHAVVMRRAAGATDHCHAALLGLAIHRLGPAQRVRHC